MKSLKSIAVFCGSSSGSRKEYEEGARALGSAMAAKGITLVYGGGGKGLMGTIAASVRKNGGHVIGILPEAMDIPSVRKNSQETELIIVPGMHERKKAMYERADAFIALPGGIGTIEEISEIYTWRQLGYHNKNIALLNTAGYWDPFIQMIDKGVAEGFISEEVRRLLIADDNIDFTKAQIFNTRLKDIDLSTCIIQGLSTTLVDIKGAIINELQIMDLAYLLNIKIKD